MSVFHFKQFDVVNERSAMKVNTDGVLLGAVTEVFPADRKVLDIGTGTGTVALMIAQRLSQVSETFSIVGIDVDLPSAEEAAQNFASSPWSEHLSAEHLPLSSLTSDCEYDLIVSNPPYFDNSLQAPDARRNAARHTGDPDSGGNTLSFREIIEYSQTHLSEDGRLAMVLPADVEKAMLRHARMMGFALWKILRVKTVERKNPSRIIVQLKKKASVSEPLDETIVLANEEARRASQQASLLTDYLCNQTNH